MKFEYVVKSPDLKTGKPSRGGLTPHFTPEESKRRISGDNCPSTLNI